MGTNNSKNQSLSSIRLLNIIEAMSACRGTVRLTDISRELNMTQSTVLRYISALCSEGYAYQDPVTGSYALTWKVCRINDNLKSNQSLRAVVSPLLNDLSFKLNSGALLAAPHEDSVLYLDMIANPANSMQAMLRIGRDAPIHSTSSGKILLSAMTDLQILRIADQKGLQSLTPYTITDADALLEEINTVRTNHYALDNEECELGHRCVSVPLLDYTGRICAAISVFDNADAITPERIEKQILPAAREAAAEISKRLGFEGQYL